MQVLEGELKGKKTERENLKDALAAVEEFSVTADEVSIPPLDLLIARIPFILSSNRVSSLGRLGWLLLTFVIVLIILFLECHSTQTHVPNKSCLSRAC